MRPRGQNILEHMSSESWAWTNCKEETVLQSHSPAIQSSLLLSFALLTPHPPTDHVFSKRIPCDSTDILRLQEMYV